MRKMGNRHRTAWHIKLHSFSAVPAGRMLEGMHVWWRLQLAQAGQHEITAEERFDPRGAVCHDVAWMICMMRCRRVKSTMRQSICS